MRQSDTKQTTPTRDTSQGQFALFCICHFTRIYYLLYLFYESWYNILRHIPYYIIIHAHIIVNQTVSHACHLSPGNTLPRILHICRNLLYFVPADSADDVSTTKVSYRNSMGVASELPQNNMGVYIRKNKGLSYTRKTTAPMTMTDDTAYPLFILKTQFFGGRYGIEK